MCVVFLRVFPLPLLMLVCKCAPRPLCSSPLCVCIPHIYRVSTSPAASTRPRAVCICLSGLCGTLQGLVESRWHFGWPWGSIVAPWAFILTHVGYSWKSFKHFGETLGLYFGTLGLHLGTLGVHVGVLWALLCVALVDPSGKRLQKGTQNGRSN